MRLRAMTDPVLSSAQSPGTPQTTWMALHLPTDPSAPWMPAERDKVIAMPGRCADWCNIKCQPKTLSFHFTDSITNLCSNWKYSVLLMSSFACVLHLSFFSLKKNKLTPQQTSAAGEIAQFLLMSSFACILRLSVARKRCLHLKICKFCSLRLK